MSDMDQTIIIKKRKHAPHAHHGGAWKIAYADFVTAMMAFFLLLWLISMTTPEQKQGLADYFSPPNVTESTSGSGGILAGKAPSENGSLKGGATSDIRANGSQESLKQLMQGNDSSTAGGSATNLRAKEDMAFRSAAVSIKQAWQALPDITEISANLLVQVTEEGLDIQIVDQNGRRMFPPLSKYPLEPARRAIAAIAPILQQLPNQIAISGYTAAGVTYPNPRYGSWELSGDRANETRSLLDEFGLSQDHISSVTGRSTSDPFFPDDPYLAANERVKITVLRAAPPLPASATP